MRLPTAQLPICYDVKELIDSDVARIAPRRRAKLKEPGASGASTAGLNRAEWSRVVRPG